MNEKTFLAFGDELVKIAFLQKLRGGFVSALKDGWHGTAAQRAVGDGQTWFGKGRQIKSNMGPISRRVEEATSLGGLTRVLPVGNKSLMAVGTAMMARDALRPVDPTGQGRSSTERMSGLAGNTIGGLAGSGLAMRLMPKSTFLAPMLGGIGGAMVGEKVMTAPWKHHRQHQPQMQEQVPQQPMPNQGVR